LHVFVENSIKTETT